MSSQPAIALTIAGSDSSGGAGIQADLKTFSAYGVYGASVITALTAQNTQGVFGVQATPPEFIRAQFAAVVSDLDVGALKVGMLGDAATANVVADLLASVRHIPAVIDPVMVATSGAVLLTDDAIAVVRDRLVPLARVLTPNLPEAAKLLKCSTAANEAEAAEQSRALLDCGAEAVLIKGGHGRGATSIDLLMTRCGVRRFERERISTKNTHGTGCTLSAAIAAGLALGRTVEDAVSSANDYVWRALAAGAARRIGGGHGPVDHAVSPAMPIDGS